MGVIPGAVTYSSYTNKFYVGTMGDEAFNIEGKLEKLYEPIATYHPSKVTMIPDGTGKLVEGPNYDRNAAVEYTNYEMLRRAERAQKKGLNFQAAVDNVSLANITRVELLTEIRNREYKQVFLINGVDRIPVPKLKLDYDIQLHIKTRGKGALTPKRQKPGAEAPEFVQSSFDMVKFGKLARLIDTPDEDELSALISPTQKSIDDISQVIGQDENAIILSDGLDQFGSVAKASWSTFTADHNTRSPLVDIATERARIVKNHGRPNVIVMNSIQWAIFVGSTFVKGHEQLFKQEQPGVFGFDKLPGFKFIIDEDILDGNVYIYDMRGLTYGEGPMVSESFRDPQAGVSGHIIRKWIEPIVPTKLKTAFGTKMTGTA